MTQAKGAALVVEGKEESSWRNMQGF